LSLDPNTGWLTFVASLASIVLTFLTGAKVDPTTLLMRTGLTFGTISSLYRAQRRDHRPHAVLAAGHGGRALGHRPHRHRPALVRPGREARHRGVDLRTELVPGHGVAHHAPCPVMVVR
jgi:hypothetical protein